jgi:hypothetical protein
MVFSRASAIRGALRAVRPSKTSVGRAQQWRQIGRRGYASHGHDAKKASSDLPWFVPIIVTQFHFLYGNSVTNYLVRLVGAVAVTVPSCWYLLQNGPNTSHGHGDHGDEHGKEHGNAHGEEHDKEESKKESESSDDKSSEKGEDSDSGDESKGADTPDTSDDEGDKDEKEGKSKDDTSSEIPLTPKKGQKPGKLEDMAESADSESKDTVLR